MQKGSFRAISMPTTASDQLVRENNQAAGKTWTYAYDDGGNIQSKTEYAYTTGSLGAAVRTVNYGYGDASWSDLLTSIGGQSLTADEIGNLLSDGTWAYTWQHGRQLAGMSKSGQTIAYGYDSDGKRITKTVNGTAYNYHYLGDQLVELMWGGNKLHFTYDSTGPLSVNCNGTEYFYVKNAQGDVTGLVNASGTRVVTYTYDAWGNLLSTTGSLATTLGEQNPLRYRGYVYDTETGLYYLQSRYYNPTWGRFINADAYLSAGGEFASNNMFAYCENNPIVRKDNEGEFWNFVIGAAVGGLISGITTYVRTGSLKQAAVSAVVGAISGAVAASGLPFLAQVAITMAVTAGGDVASQVQRTRASRGQTAEKTKINWRRTLKNTTVAGGLAIAGTGVGSLVSYQQMSIGKTLLSKAQDKLLKGYVRQALGQSSSSLIRQGRKLAEQAAFYINTARGISSVAGSMFAWAPSVKYSE